MSRDELVVLLRCPVCREPLVAGESEARCGKHAFPVRGGIPRLLPPDLMRLWEGGSGNDLRARTYRSFGYEWSAFATQRSDYQRNFRWYLEPLPLETLSGLRVLDAGCGMGRHTYHFLQQGAQVVAMDASRAVEVAAHNNQGTGALFVQADLLALPLATEVFDVVCCLGVLHHIERTEDGLKQLVGVTRKGGWVVAYLYHDLADAGRLARLFLRAASAMRKLTVHMPLAVLRPLTWLMAVFLLVGYVGPLKLVAHATGTTALARGLPLGQYVDYPFAVLWNDQFDRFSAPLEKRFARDQVEELLSRCGLLDVRILGGHGWRVAGRKPGQS